LWSQRLSPLRFVWSWIEMLTKPNPPLVGPPVRLDRGYLIRNTASRAYLTSRGSSLSCSSFHDKHKNLREVSWNLSITATINSHALQVLRNFIEFAGMQCFSGLSLCVGAGFEFLWTRLRLWTTASNHLHSFSIITGPNVNYVTIWRGLELRLLEAPICLAWSWKNLCFLKSWKLQRRSWTLDNRCFSVFIFVHWVGLFWPQPPCTSEMVHRSKSSASSGRFKLTPLFRKSQKKETLRLPLPDDGGWMLQEVCSCFYVYPLSSNCWCAATVRRHAHLVLDLPIYVPQHLRVVDCREPEVTVWSICSFKGSPTFWRASNALP